MVTFRASLERTLQEEQNVCERLKKKGGSIREGWVNFQKGGVSPVH